MYVLIMVLYTGVNGAFIVSQTEYTGLARCQAAGKAINDLLKADGGGGSVRFKCVPR